MEKQRANKPLVLLLLLSASLHLSSCGVVPSPEAEILEVRISSGSVVELVLSVHSGSVYVSQAPGTEILIRTGADQQPEWSLEGGTLLLTRENSRQQSPVELLVPAGTAIEVNTDRGDILIEGISGSLELSSVNGSIEAVDSHGAIRLRAQRGDAFVSGCSGTLAAVGDHGVLTASSFRGTVSMSTIMGTLVYIAPPGAAYEVRLESDHGPVQVNLPADADMDVMAETISGSKACVGVDLRQTYNGCEGVLGDGGGSLSIRTVSGRVDIRVTPAIMEVQDD